MLLQLKFVSNQSHDQFVRFVCVWTLQAEAYTKLESADESRKQAMDSVEKLKAELYATKVIF